jgi:hypothetical protein
MNNNEEKKVVRHEEMFHSVPASASVPASPWHRARNPWAEARNPFINPKDIKTADFVRQQAVREVLRKYFLDDGLRPQYDGMSAWELAGIILRETERDTFAPIVVNDENLEGDRTEEDNEVFHERTMSDSEAYRLAH